MKVKYLGPGSSVNVHPYGAHAEGETKDYPEDFTRELLLTSRENRFEVEEPPEEPGDERTVKELLAELEARGIEAPKNARKADLARLLEDEEGGESES